MSFVITFPHCGLVMPYFTIDIFRDSVTSCGIHMNASITKYVYKLHAQNDINTSKGSKSRLSWLQDIALSLRSGVEKSISISIEIFISIYIIYIDNLRQHYNEVVGVYIGFTPSVRPSVPIPCPLGSACSSGWIHFIFIHLIKQLQKVCRVFISCKI